MGIFIRNAVKVISHHVLIENKVTDSISGVGEIGNIKVPCLDFKIRIETRRGREPNRV